MDKKLELEHVDGFLFLALLSELDLQSGDLSTSRSSAAKLLRESRSVAIKATAHRILAEACASLLQFEDSLSHYRAARALCREGVPNWLAAEIDVSFCSWLSSVLPQETSEAEFMSVRKTVVIDSEPRHLAELHLCAARLEARRGSITEARRHWELAEALLKTHRNLRVESHLQLDGCLIALLAGDTGIALNYAKRGGEVGQEAGYFRGIVASLVEQAHVLRLCGDLPGAQGLAELALAQAGDHKQLRVAALDCVANVRFASRDFSGADSVLDEITRLLPTSGLRVARRGAGLSDLSDSPSLSEPGLAGDRPRGDQKAPTALWPASTLETDGGLWVSEQMTELLSIAKRIAPSDISILLTGETGTGKEVLARAIHRASSRSAKPFVLFNCSAVPREMLESQLFGYRKGAFAGADNAFDGIIRAAAGGTLFLDEIAEIGPELQPKLLPFLETHEVHGLGEPQPVKVDIRIIAATNADVESLVADRRLREDLFYRLNVVRLRVPPLRERREEIPPLIDHYLRKFAAEQKKGPVSLDDETLEYLVLYSWPGNVRQLVNELNRLVALADPDGTVTPALLSPEIQASRRTVRVVPGEEPEIRIRLDQPLNDAVDAIERVMVTRALHRAGGNYENAAKLLGISRKGLFLKRRRWGMRKVS